jgi:hypothetical protein
MEYDCQTFKASNFHNLNAARFQKLLSVFQSLQV